MNARATAYLNDPAFGRAGRIASHVLYWLAALAFFTIYFGRPQNEYVLSLAFVSALLPITVATTYMLLYVLIPRYLLQRRYALFALYFTYTLLFSFYLEVALVVVLFITVAEYQAIIVKPDLVNQLDVIAGMYLVVFLAAALHLLKRWYAMQTLNTRLTEARLEAELKLKEAELALLRSQLHPHFLFNTLNNLYGLTLEQSDRAPEVVLRIAEMLDYMIYRGDAMQVPLDDEIAFLRNYVALEQLRHHEGVRVDFEINGSTSGWSVAPLLFMPFVENSFKHGLNTSGRSGWIRITLTVSETELRFRVANSRGAAPARPIPGASSGIGLENVRRRLNHLYPARHMLHIEELSDAFIAELVLGRTLTSNQKPAAFHPAPATDP